MRFSLPLAAAAAVCAAAPLHAQQADDDRPVLLQVAAAPNGVVLSLDSASITRTGESTFFAAAVYKFPPDVALASGADTQIETQEMDCAQNRFRNRGTMVMRNDVPVPQLLLNPLEMEHDHEWKQVDDGDAPIFGAICAYLQQSFAAAMPVATGTAHTRAPALTNRMEVSRLLAQEYPRPEREAGITGTVVLRARVTAQGTVDSASAHVVRASNMAFVAPAERVGRRMRFRPASVDGQAVRVWITIPITFQLGAATTVLTTEESTVEQRPVNTFCTGNPTKC